METEEGRQETGDRCGRQDTDAGDRRRETDAGDRRRETEAGDRRHMHARRRQEITDDSLTSYTEKLAHLN